MSVNSQPALEGSDGALTWPAELVDAIAQRAAQLLDERGAAGDRWLSADEAAEYIRAGRRRVYDLIHQGALVPGRDGSRVLLRQSQLDAYLEGRG